MPHSLSIDILRIKPYWLSAAQAVVPFTIGEGPGIDIVGSTVGFGGDTILQYHVSGVPVAEFAFTQAGLTAGLAALAAGEWLRINTAGTITGNFTIPADTQLLADSQVQFTIAGTVTMGSNSVLTNINIAATANDANALYGVLGPTTTAAYLFDCNVHATQSGAGNAYAVGCINGTAAGYGDVYVYRTRLHGISAGGSGYAARSTAGVFRMWHGSAYGSTARWTTS